MINVLIVEDDPMARQLLEIYINASEKYNHIQSVERAALFFPEKFALKYDVRSNTNLYNVECIGIGRR